MQASLWIFQASALCGIFSFALPAVGEILGPEWSGPSKPAATAPARYGKKLPLPPPGLGLAIGAPVGLAATTGAAAAAALTLKNRILQESFDPQSAADLISLGLETGYMAGAAGLVSAGVLGAPLSVLSAACYGIFQGGKALAKKITPRGADK